MTATETGTECGWCRDVGCDGDHSGDLAEPFTSGEYAQSTTACCPRETIPDSCSCLDGCSCLCADCICDECGDDDD